MKNSQEGFLAFAASVIIFSLLLLGGGYLYLNKAPTQEQATHSDKLIEIGMRSLIIKSTEYYRNNASYASSALSLNNGICSDTGEYGLKNSLDAIAQIAGEYHCYASRTGFAVSVPLKSNPAIGYCIDNTGTLYQNASPTAASVGYCGSPKQANPDISSCKNQGETARERWACVGNIVDSNDAIFTIVMPFVTPVSKKIDFCKTFKGVEADYCFSSIVQASHRLGENGEPSAANVCAMVSNENPWFKADCGKDTPSN